MSDERTWRGGKVICIRTEHGRPSKPAEPRKCADCGASVWTDVNPPTPIPDGAIACIECAGDAIAGLIVDGERPEIGAFGDDKSRMGEMAMLLLGRVVQRLKELVGFPDDPADLVPDHILKARRLDDTLGKGPAFELAERGLREMTLEAIACGAPNPVELAQMAVRWDERDDEEPAGNRQETGSEEPLDVDLEGHPHRPPEVIVL